MHSYILLPLLLSFSGLSAQMKLGNKPAQSLHDENSPSLNGTLQARQDTWGGFLNSCYDVRYYLSDADAAKDRPSLPSPYLDSPLLVARCPTFDGSIRCSTLRLGDCMMNQNGQLQPADGGHFHLSCFQCAMRMDGQSFWCRCVNRQDGKDYIQVSVLDLNQIVNNWDGDLACYAHKGERHDRCPDEDSFDPTKDAPPGSDWGSVYDGF